MTVDPIDDVPLVQQKEVTNVPFVVTPNAANTIYLPKVTRHHRRPFHKKVVIALMVICGIIIAIGAVYGIFRAVTHRIYKNPLRKHIQYHLSLLDDFSKFKPQVVNEEVRFEKGRKCAHIYTPSVTHHNRLFNKADIVHIFAINMSIIRDSNNRCFIKPTRFVSNVNDSINQMESSAEESKSITGVRMMENNWLGTKWRGFRREKSDFKSHFNPYCLNKKIFKLHRQALEQDKPSNDEPIAVATRRHAMLACPLLSCNSQCQSYKVDDRGCETCDCEDTGEIAKIARKRRELDILDPAELMEEDSDECEMLHFTEGFFPWADSNEKIVLDSIKLCDK